MSTTKAQEWLISNNKFEDELSTNNQFRVKKAKTISITGGKGGVGKSSISLKLSRTLAENGYKVLLVDCDYNLSNTSIKLGLPVNNDFQALVKREKTIDECLYKEKTFHLLPGCNGNLELFRDEFKLDQFIIEILLKQEQNYDFIFLDSPAGVRKENLTLNAYSDYRFVVVNPDKSSLTDAYSLMKILKNDYGIHDNHLIINKSTSTKQVQKIVKVLSETVENFLNTRLQILGSIERSSENMDNFDRHMLKNSASKIHNDFLEIINNFVEKTLGLPALAPIGATCNLGLRVPRTEHEVQVKT